MASRSIATSISPSRLWTTNGVLCLGAVTTMLGFYYGYTKRDAESGDIESQKTLETLNISILKIAQGLSGLMLERQTLKKID